ncbi:MAG: hypothetical protein JWQ27_616 [Ferruginibacter sp.]|nr:hypothetical protein [Ferruginibacter sp.]
MIAIAFYMLKVTTCSALLFGYYFAFLRNKAFHRYNRLYLLATVLLSLILPLIKFNINPGSAATTTSFNEVLRMVNRPDMYMEEIIIYSRYNHISKEQIALFIFISGCLFLGVRFLKTLRKIYRLKRHNPQQQYRDIHLIYTEDSSTPFSFLKNIFWNNGIDINSKNGKRILKHELAHVEEKHSYDKLFINIALIFSWANPVFWLLRKELNMIHEFLADQKAVEDGDTAAFATMILQTTSLRHSFELTNNFFYSPIKRRLTMLTKNNQTKVGYLSRLLVLPLMIIVFAAFSLKTNYHPLPEKKQELMSALNTLLSAVNEKPAMLKDTLPPEKPTTSDNGIIVVSAAEIKFNKYNANTENSLVIINGKEYYADQLENKVIRGSKGTFYPKNHPEMLKKYGAKAYNGVIVFENASIAANVEERVVTDIRIDSTVKPNQPTTGSNVVIRNVAGVPLEPLIVIDKKISTKKDMEVLNPNDIMEVSILKDKNAEVKYGEQGKNGVIEIRMKEQPLRGTLNPVELDKKDLKEITVTGYPTQQSPNIIFTKVEQEPEFPGGAGAWREYLKKNLNATQPVDEGWAAGTYQIIVRFIVDRDGNVSDVVAENYAASKTAEMCVSLIKKGPRWKPAMQNGRVVKAYKKQPITFVVSAE